MNLKKSTHFHEIYGSIKLDDRTQVIIPYYPGMQVRFGRYLQQEYMTSARNPQGHQANFYGNNQRTPILPSGKLT